MDSLRNLAESDRRGRYEPGFGLLESSFRERSGDYAGAVIAAYKDLAYGYSHGLIDRETIDERLKALEASYSDAAGDHSQEVLSAVHAIRLFMDGDWGSAISVLETLRFDDERQFDSFASWMKSVAMLEQSSLSSVEIERYAVMQARYSLFPEYWYRFARAQEEVELRRDSAERCVALAPSGPLAKEARSMIAVSYGLVASDGASMLIPSEIESIAARAVQTGDPERLAAMLPVLGLADNASTLYAVGTLKGLCASDAVREWLSAKASSSSGRIAERLRYITGR